MTYQSTLISFDAFAVGHFRNARMKLCFLWFDEIVFEDIGLHNREAFLSGIDGFSALEQRRKSLLLEAVSPLSERLRIDWKANRLERMHRGYPRWGPDYRNYDYREPETADQFAHNALLRKIEGGARGRSS